MLRLDNAVSADSKPCYTSSRRGDALAVPSMAASSSVSVPESTGYDTVYGRQACAFLAMESSGSTQRVVDGQVLFGFLGLPGMTQEADISIKHPQTSLSFSMTLPVNGNHVLCVHRVQADSVSSRCQPDTTIMWFNVAQMSDMLLSRDTL